MVLLSPAPDTKAPAAGYELVTWRIIGGLLSFGASAFLVFAGLRIFFDHWR
jgi:hypothetical protein